MCSLRACRASGRAYARDKVNAHIYFVAGMRAFRNVRRGGDVVDPMRQPLMDAVALSSLRHATFIP
jgi:hypothetical protein